LINDQAMGEFEVFLSEGCGSSCFNSMKCFPSGANSPKFPGFGYRDGSLKMLSSVSALEGVVDCAQLLLIADPTNKKKQEV
jgi:hypothetical protein